MGKYSKVLNVKGTSPETKMLVCIANELEEANRLKRIELKILAAGMDIPKTMQEASEDRA